MSDNPTSTGAEDPSIDNLWGDAMSEQQAASSASQSTGGS